MTIPTNPELTKLRILAKRKEAIYLQAHKEYECAWLSYVQECRNFGYCAACEEKLSDCRCIAVANIVTESFCSGSELSPEWQEVMT